MSMIISFFSNFFSALRMTEKQKLNYIGLALRNMWLSRLHLGALRLRALVVFSVLGSIILAASTAQATSRIKDIADFEGVRDNFLVGYGLVVGLDGDGDTLNSAVFTRESLVGMLERLGVRTRENVAALRADNVAAVMVTATLPAFARQGTRIDVTLGTMGDAEDLGGGILLVTPLLGADGEVYAVAQGNIVVGGFTVTGDAAEITKGVPTSGRIPNGAIVEKQTSFEFASLEDIHISLRNPDFTTARRIARAINAYLSAPAARPIDSGTVYLSIPATHAGDIVGLVTDIEQLLIEPDNTARVAIDEASGVIVMGQQVRINPVAVAMGNLTITVTETPQVSQPSPFAQVGETEIVPRTVIEVDEGDDSRLTIVRGGVSLDELVNGLNSLGVGPRDLITILQTIKAAGALQAEIELL